MPAGDNRGVDKYQFHKEKWEMRGVNETTLNKRFRGLQDAWKEEGLRLTDRSGHWGNSFDAQRLISLARKQGREDAFVEAVYAANHEQNLALSSWEVLLSCARAAGIAGAQELLEGDQEAAEVRSKIQKHIDMGINAVPVLIFNDRYRIDGAPEAATIAEVFSRLLAGDNAAL